MPAKKHLSENTRIVQHFQRAVDFCTLGHVPQTTRELLTTGAWRERFEMGRRIQFKSIVEFITVPASQGGCGWQPDKVTELLRKSDDSEALRMWEAAIKAREIDAKDQANRSQQGKRTDLVDSNRRIIHEVKGRPTGTSAAAFLRRLRKDRPDIHARVLAGELTANAGMIEAGFRKKRPSQKLTTLQKIRRMIPKLSESEREELIQDLIGERKRVIVSKDQLAMFQ
jgi:hypothetical protein